MAEKNGILFLLKYLHDYTDEDHQVNTAQIRKILQKNGYNADPRTIRKQIAMMAEAGFEIVSNERAGLPTEYFYNGWEWDRNEAMILIDAVSSAPFITQKRTNRLIEKLSVLPGEMYRDTLTPNVVVSEHIKAKNEQLPYILENIAQAIQNRKKISYKMTEYNPEMKLIERHGGEVYVLSPYDTIWKEDHYYVVGMSDKRGTVISTRIDRMSVPEILEEDAVPPPEDYHIQEYTDAVTRMFKGRYAEVKLRCRNRLINQVIDKFGTDFKRSDLTSETFDATVSVAVSGTFLSWVFQYAGEMTIISPDPVKDMYEKMMGVAMDDLAAEGLDPSEDYEWKL